MTQKLPIGVQDFEKLISENFIYVDKTKLLYQLITQGNVYFLSRPRRFGKSLLVSTLSALFQAKRELFNHLWIDQSDYRWEKYPVISLDMSKIPNQDSKTLDKYLTNYIADIAKQYHQSIDRSLPCSVALDKLIDQLAEERKHKVVVLVDEYDKPLIDQLHKPEIAAENREILKHFYGILKAQDANLRFVMLTGVSKFSKVSVFSGLNNLNDISLSTRYASLLGYTDEELCHYFSFWIEKLAQKENLTKKTLIDKIKYWYNGYQFSEFDVQVYNPFSTLLLFEHQRFAAHWFATGTPTFLINLIEQKKFDIASIENLKMAEADFSVYEIDKLDVLPLLYQTGYLTIKSYHAEKNYYMLGYPNWEVENGFLEALLVRFSKIDAPVQSNFIFDMVEALEERRFAEFFRLLKAFLASIPYDLHIKSEKYYQNIFYFIFTLVGLRLGAEVHTNRGRIDAVLELADSVMIFEFKIDQSATEALKQIQSRGYAEKYQHQRKKLFFIGVNFSSAERNISDYAIA